MVYPQFKFVGENIPGIPLSKLSRDELAFTQLV